MASAPLMAIDVGRAVDEHARNDVAVGQDERVRREIVADARAREEDRLVKGRAGSAWRRSPTGSGPTSFPSPLTMWHFAQVPFVAKTMCPFCGSPGRLASCRSAAAAWRRRPAAAGRACRPGCGCPPRARRSRAAEAASRRPSFELAALRPGQDLGGAPIFVRATARRACRR